MDAKHRHELKTNELADWIGHLPGFLSENIRTIIGIVLIIAASVVFVYARRTRSSTNFAEKAQATAQIINLDMGKMSAIASLQAEKESPDTILISASQLEIAADNSKTPQVKALLLIKRGEALRSDLHYRAEEVDADIVQDRIKKARESYEKALTLAEGNSTITAMANLGLGLCAEETGDYTRARQIYESIVADEKCAGTVFPAQAQNRLDTMADNMMEFVFVKAPPKPEPPKVDLSDVGKTNSLSAADIAVAPGANVTVIDSSASTADKKPVVSVSEPNSTGGPATAP
jgi:hypothetical protein